MHAYLLIGQTTDNLQLTTENLAKKLKAKIMEFPLKKIDDVRALNSFTSLAVSQPTAILINSIEEATTEAMNAFLKNLEEPQDNLYYILTTSSLAAVLPTIVSRCEIIKLKNGRNEEIKNGDLEKFFNKSVGEKLAYTDKIKDRGEAINFVQELIFYLHNLLQKTKENYIEIAKNLRNLSRTLTYLKANGNVNLQLTRMIINLV
jgi:DNA polymerase III gamma/tau subunit